MWHWLAPTVELAQQRQRGLSLEEGGGGAKVRLAPEVQEAPDVGTTLPTLRAALRALDHAEPRAG